MSAKQVIVVSLLGLVACREPRDPGSRTAPQIAASAPQIAYFAEADGNPDIYTVRADGSEPRRLTDHRSEDSYPSFSPDGSRILFESNRSGNFEIYVMQADGSDPEQLTRHEADDLSAAWSPDGASIVFVSFRDGDTSEIYRINLDGSELTRLTDNAFDDEAPHPSPDGRFILTESGAERARRQVYIMGADGSDHRPLTDLEAYCGYPTWSPDMATITFDSDLEGDSGIFAIDADGSNLRRLGAGKAASFANWSPDGQSILVSGFIDGQDRVDLYVMDPDGDNWRAVVQTDVNEVAPSWNPRGFLRHRTVAAVQQRARHMTRNEKGHWQADLGDGHFMTYVPGGSFATGPAGGGESDQPTHRVMLDGYWIGTYPVTVAQFRAFVRDTAYVTDAEAGEGCWIEHGGGIRYDASWHQPLFDQPDDHSVLCVSWNDAMAFAAWLGTRTGLPLTLPSEAQWEKAARGTDGRAYPWGNDPPDGSQANFADRSYQKAFPEQRNPSHDIDDGHVQTSPVDAYPAGVSPYGVFDLAGNTIDWLVDWSGASQDAIRPERNPAAPRPKKVRHKFSVPGGWSSNLQRSIRGGAWTDASGQLSVEEGGHSIRSDRRESTDQFSSDDHMSFRLAIDMDRGPSEPERERASVSLPGARATVTEAVGDATVQFQYARGRVAGREGRLFGHDVPYGEPWSIADPNPALFSADRDVLVERQNLPAGTYAIEIIPSRLGPGSEPWTVIFKSWHGRKGVGEEVLRVRSPAQLEDNSKEDLEVFFDTKPGRGVIARVLWEYVEVHIALAGSAETDLDDPIAGATAAEVMNTFGRREVAVSYERHVASQLPVFGTLLPYDAAWPSRADEMILEARGNVLIAGRAIKAGRYALRLVPRITGPWNVTLTPIPGQAEGAPLTLEATVDTSESPEERLELFFDAGPDADGSLMMAWGEKVVSLAIEADQGRGTALPARDLDAGDTPPRQTDAI